MTQRNLADMSRFLAVLGALVLGGCAVSPAPTVPPACPPCPGVELPKPAAKPLQPAEWRDLPGWEADDHAAVLALFRTQCASLGKRPLWL